MWQRIGTECFDQSLELAVILDGVTVWSLAPCRRVIGGWVHCDTHEPVRFRPTHWRSAQVTCRFGCRPSKLATKAVTAPAA